jgi:hypothetical protein
MHALSVGFRCLLWPHRRHQPVQHAPDFVDRTLQWLMLIVRQEPEAPRDFELNIYFRLRAESDVQVIEKHPLSFPPFSFTNVGWY